jgi:hypothetical protein
MEVPSMLSEYFIDLCFIRAEPCESIRIVEKLQEEIRRIFPVVSTIYIDHKREEGLEIAVCELNGLSMWETEEELLMYVEEKLSDECWSWLTGYRLQVIPKEDAGTCSLKKGDE